MMWVVKNQDVRRLAVAKVSCRWLLLFVLLLVGAPAGTGAAMIDETSKAAETPVRLTTEHETEPLDVDVARPHFAWQLDGGRGGVVQGAYQIAVASDPSLLASGEADVWDSTQVVSVAQADVAYKGPSLESNATYFWAVRVWTDAGGSPGDWSAPARFETGLLHPSDWVASWIGRDNPREVPPLGEQARAPMLRKDFTLARAVVRARLRIVGLGYYVAWINGERIGNQVLDPPPSAFDKTVLYATHDVTDVLRQGGNAIGVTLGRGYFGAPKSDSLIGLAAAPWRSEPRLLAQLDVTYDDGTTTRVVSDGTWRMADGPILDSAWEGEHYDARLEQPGWNDVGFDDAGWVPAPEQTAPAPEVRATAMEPIEIVETLQPVSISTPAPGVSVYDFGRMTAGWAQIAAQGEAGTTISLTYGETLDGDGKVVTLDDYGPSVHVDSYTLAGREQEQWEPSFARHGFRYVQVVSSPSAPRSLSVVARVNHTTVATTGDFTCANDLLNRLHANQRTSLLSNLWGFPTDTPWRDRAGWTADAWLTLDSAAYNFGVLRLYAQWLRTFRESQADDGSLPVIAPNLPLLGTSKLFDPSWSGTLIFDAWSLYRYYGDPRLLSENYDAMTRWVDLMDRTVAATDDVYRGFSFGDWASPGVEASGSVNLFPPEGSALTATADLHREARTLARIAGVLGRPADVERYDAVADRVADGFNRAFFDPDADVYGTTRDAEYRQTSNLIALAYGLVPAAREEAVYRNLVDDIRRRGEHLNTGAIGTKLLLPLLAERGDVDLAYRIATQATYPSWGYWVAQGATSSWETWSHAGPSQSLNHAFLGTFDEWLYMYVAGIQPADPGYASVRIKPEPPSDLDRASASVVTPRGEVRSSWMRRNGTFQLTVSIPGNTSAEVHVPAGIGAAVMVRGAGGVSLLRRGDGHAVFTAGSGEHVFEVRNSGGSSCLVQIGEGGTTRRGCRVVAGREGK